MAQISSGAGGSGKAGCVNAGDAGGAAISDTALDLDADLDDGCERCSTAGFCEGLCVALSFPLVLDDIYEV